MLRYLLPEHLRPGERPGALADSDATPASNHPLRIRHLSFDTHSVTETEYTDFDECPGTAIPGRVDWLHFQGGVSPALLRQLRDTFDLHPLALEDIQNVGQRPKMEVYGENLFVTVARPTVTDSGPGFEQVSLFVSAELVLSFHAGSEDIFAPVRQRIHAGKGRIRTGGAGYLLYALTDVVVDHGFPVLERYADALDTLEERIFSDPRRDPVPAIHAIKRDLIGLRKVLWHQSAMLGHLLRSDHALLDESTRPYLRDADDHARRINDLLDGYRDACTSLLDTHLSLSAARLNDIMKVLTLIATIFMPLSFLAGIYGMNFDTASPYNMPELGYRYAYPILLGVMIVSLVGMLTYFRRRKWF